MKLLTLSAVICSLLFSANAIGQSIEEPPSRSILLEHFKLQEGEKWDIRWNSNNNMPRAIIGDLTPPTSKNPREVALSYLKKYPDLFGYNRNEVEFRIEDIIYSKGTSSVVIKQYYKNIPIYKSDFRFHLDHSNSINLMHGHLFTDIKVENNITKNKSDIASFITGLGSTPQGSTVQSELVIYPINDTTFVYAYDVYAKSKEYLYNTNFIVDASQVLIYSENSLNTQFYHFENKTNTSKANVLGVKKDLNHIDENNIFVTGTGKVYPKHPDISTFQSTALFRLAGNDRLEGTYIKVIEHPGPVTIYGANDNFTFSESDSKVTGVMAYYHADRFRSSYINSIDNSFSTDKITYTVNLPSSTVPLCNAQYNSGSNKILMGSKDTGVCENPGYEDKVIMHEYTHAVTHELNSAITSTQVSGEEEEFGIHEGVADYFPGSFTGRALIGDYIGGGFQRSMHLPEFDDYSDLSSATLNEYGEFFSAILWDIRNSSGVNNSTFDELVFETVRSLNGSPDFEDFKYLLYSKDLSLNSGNYKYRIYDTFAEYGVGGYFPLDVVISGPTSMNSGEYKTWNSSVINNTAETPFSYKWRVVPLGTSMPGTLVSTSGTYYGTQSASFDLFLTVTDNRGVDGTDRHFVTVETGGGCDPWNPCKVNPTVSDRPENFSLFNNYPNPFNPSTNIKFGLPEQADVIIEIYNLMGQKVATLINGSTKSGYHTITFDATNLSNGIYFAKMTATTKSNQKFETEIKMQLIK